jgi:hypothetical protein
MSNIKELNYLYFIKYTVETSYGYSDETFLFTGIISNSEELTKKLGKLHTDQKIKIKEVKVLHPVTSKEQLWI